MDEQELLPSEVRARILDAHEALRGRIAHVRELAGDVGVEAGARRYREATEALLEALSEHLALEDAILVPTLATIDAWGPERRQRLEAEHVRQQAMMASVRQSLTESTSDPWRIVARVERLMDDLEADMAFEEETSLSPELMDERPVRVDIGS